MIMINRNWEQIKDLSDIVRICAENIGEEFANEVQKVFCDNEQRIKELEDDIKELILKENCLKSLNDQLDILEDYIDEN